MCCYAAAAGLWAATRRGDGPPAVNPAVSGGAVADFDNDGWQDVFYASGGAAPDALYLNKVRAASPIVPDRWRAHRIPEVWKSASPPDAARGAEPGGVRLFA